MSAERKSKRRVTRLVCQAQQGQAAAFEELYQLYWPELCYYMQIRLKNDTVRAEDIAQETFLQIFNKIGQLKEPKSFTAWMYRVAQRTLLNALREESRYNQVAEVAVNQQKARGTDCSQLPENLTADHERRDLVMECLNQLDESQRSILLLRYVAELNATEIAAILQRSPGTIRNQLVVARRELKIKLQEHPLTLKSLLLGFALVVGRASVISCPFRGEPVRPYGPYVAPPGSLLAPKRGVRPASKLTAPSLQTKVGTYAALGAITLAAAAALIGVQPLPAPVKAKELTPVSPAPQAPPPQTRQSEQNAQEPPAATPPTVAGGAATPTPAKGGKPLRASRRTVPPTSPAAVVAEPVAPVITLARQHIVASIGDELSPEQILLAAGARAADSENRPVAVTLVGYDAAVFARAGSYALTVIARDGQGVKAKSLAVFVDVQ